MDEVDLRRRIERGRQATALLENPFFKEAIEKVKDEVWQQFSKSAPEDDTGRRYARAKLDAVNGVMQSIRWFESDAKVADSALRYDEKRKTA